MDQIPSHNGVIGIGLGTENLWSKAHCEYLRMQARQKFFYIQDEWTQCGQWAYPARTRFLLRQMEGERNNRHIVDTTHILALRAYVAGFSEGNTSTSRPWFKIRNRDPHIDKNPRAREWLDHFTKRCQHALNRSNFYYAASEFYTDFGVFNTGAHYIEETSRGLHYYTLTPGSYYCLNNNLGVADVLVRQFTLTVKALIDQYGTKDEKGDWIWDNFSIRVKNLYMNSNYTQKIDLVTIVKPNEYYDPSKPAIQLNKPWISLHYELGGSSGQYYQDGQEFGMMGPDPLEMQVFLRKAASKRKPFIVGRSPSSENFEYGEKGPTLDSLGLIKSLNKKAIGKDIALDQMLKPTVQGPASLRKSYITTAPNSFIPLDPTAAASGGLKPVFQVNPAIAALNQDVSDLRTQVEKNYYADYLMYLTMNPKTRTATETNAVVQEQQLIIGPNLQSLNWTYNDPNVELVMQYVLDEDPDLLPPPPELANTFASVEYISVFAQAQRSADLPSIDNWIQKMAQLAAIPGFEQIRDKVDVDAYADLVADRLYLPEGLNRPTEKAEAMRQQAMVQQQRQQMMNEHIPALAQAHKDVNAGNASGQGT